MAIFVAHLFVSSYSFPSDLSEPSKASLYINSAFVKSFNPSWYTIAMFMMVIRVLGCVFPKTFSYALSACW